MSPIIKFFALSLSLVACNPARQQDLLDEVSGVEDYNTPNKRSGKFLHEWALSKDKTGNAEEMGNYFEGDIMLNRKARNGLIETSRKWKDGKIPYEINGNFNQQQKNLLSDAIEQLQKNTCLKFIPRGGERDFISIEDAQTGCWSSVGKVGGKQTVNLQIPGCMSKVGSVAHELLHAVGFYHEQSRFDRDDHVHVNYQNIPYDKFINFEKVSEDEISTFGVSYDVLSVLHYSPYAFSKNNRKTIEAISNPKLNDMMGQRDGLSAGDILKVNAMYCT